MRCSNVRTIYKKQNYLKSLFSLLLVKIEEFKKKNLVTFKIKKQLISKIIYKVYTKRDQLINKKIVFFFYVILVFDKLSLKIKLLRLYYNNLLAKYFEIKLIVRLNFDFNFRNRLNLSILILEINLKLNSILLF